MDTPLVMLEPITPHTQIYSEAFQLWAYQLPEVRSRPVELGRGEAGVCRSFLPRALHPRLHKLRRDEEAASLLTESRTSPLGLL